LKILFKVISLMLTDIIFAGLMVNDEIYEHELFPYRYFKKFIFPVVN